MKVTMQQLPTLYHTSKTGAIVQWNIWTEGAVIVREYGQMGGKMQVARTTATGKNIGRSNETAPDEQAILEAQAKWTKQTDKGYVERIEDVHKITLYTPMLAQKFEDRLSELEFPLPTSVEGTTEFASE